MTAVVLVALLDFRLIKSYKTQNVDGGLADWPSSLCRCKYCIDVITKLYSDS